MNLACRLSSLLEDLDAECLYSPSLSASDPLITQITLDRNEVQQGTFFIARQAWYLDTHQWIDEVIKKGASAILVSHKHKVSFDLLAEYECSLWYIEKEDPTLGMISSRFYQHPSQSLKVYGVTGTNGKTSTVHFLSELLTQLGERVASMGTVEYRFEERKIVATNTTPDALVIQRFARHALDLGATALVLEVSSHALSLKRIAGLSFDVVGFTSLGRDHLDFHGSFEDYRNAKGLLFSSVLEWSQKQGKKVGGVAHSDSNGLNMLKRMPKKSSGILCHVQEPLEEGSIQQNSPLSSHQLTSEDPFLSLSLFVQAHPHLTGSTLWGTFQSLQLSSQSLKLIGDYHPSNLAIALGMIAHTHPTQLADVWQTLPKLKEVKGRLEKIPPYVSSSQQTLLIDYAHTPDALERVLHTIRTLHKGQIITVFGCGGDRDRGKRPLMTQSALQYSNQVMITSDNPRSEDPLSIIQDTLQLPHTSSPEHIKNISIQVDRRLAIHHAFQHLEPDGVLLIAGKGHETTQSQQNRIYALDDQEALKASMYADFHQCSLDEVPFTMSCALSNPNDPAQSLLAWIKEAQMRPQGLSLLLVSESLQTLQGFLPSLYQSHPHLLPSFFCIHSLSSLLDAPHSLSLTPKHRFLILGEHDQERQMDSSSLAYFLSLCTGTLPYLPKTLFSLKTLSEQRTFIEEIQSSFSSLKGGKAHTHFIPFIPTLSS